MLPTKFRSIWPSGFREEDFLEINQSETRIACGGQWPCLLTDWDEISNLHRKPSIYASYQVSIQAILVSDWLISKKSSSLKPLG
jgi:hypothetical protein